MKTGLEVFIEKSFRKYRGMRLGVLCNQASVDAKMRHIHDLVLQKKLGLNITCFLGPQHGIRGEKQDNMVESQDFTDPRSGKPVFSLYADTREPTEKMCEHFDTLVVDLQDIGTRIYTFIYTLANCMRAAKKYGKKVVVLDRPNPIDGLTLEGNCLEPEFTSFVGQYPIIVRHGMTIGELALMFNEHFGIGCDLEIIRLQGWKRAMHADQWKRDWVTPSPNIPTYLSALVFPAGVYFEGTNLSEGRGTTKPFEYVGAPFIDADAFAAHLNAQKMPGVYFRPIFFQPTYQKCKDQVCGGLQFHVTDRKKFNGFLAGIRIIEAAARLYGHSFNWKKPPYEYEHTRMPIDLIAGTALLRELVEQGKPLKELEKKAVRDVAAFKKLRKPFLLYR